MRTGTALLLVISLFGLSACKPAGSVELSSTDPRSPPAVQPAEAAGDVPVSAQAPSAAAEADASVAYRPPETATAKGKEVTVVMASATLGEDCGQGLEPAPAPKKEKASASDEMKAGSVTQGAHRSVAGRRACQQTSMQLSIAAGADAQATEIRVKKVQILDKSGKVVAELTARTPSVWAEDGAYTVWNQKIAAGKTLSVTYPLSAPGLAVNARNEVYTLKAKVGAVAFFGFSHL